MTDKKQQVIDIIKDMTVMELSELVKELQEIFGVSAAAPVAAATAAAPAEEVEEQTEFTVILTSVGDKKIQTIKAVRELTQLGLKEAKELVDTCPKPIVENVSKDEAEKVKKKIEDAGASAEIK